VKWLILFVLVLVLVGVGAAACGSGHGAAATALPTRSISVQAGGAPVPLTVEIASTESEREQGLMYRQSLAETAGMLFLFPAPSSVGFWMKNTYIPLDIAYLDDLGRVMQIVQGKPLSEALLSPASPYHAVLEVAGGWFQRHNLGVGATVKLPANLPRAQ